MDPKDESSSSKVYSVSSLPLTVLHESSSTPGSSDQLITSAQESGAPKGGVVAKSGKVSQSAPSSPPITTITAASPEPPKTVSPPLNGTSSSSPEKTLSPNMSRSPVRSTPQFGGGSGGGSGSASGGPRRRGSAAQVGSRRKSRELMPGPIRRASQALISLTSPGDGNSLYGECSRRDSRIVPQVTLLNSNIQRLPMKDFGAEVRASMDVDQFLQQAVLLLDVNETSLEGIVDKIVRKVLDGKEPLATLKEAKTVLFTHESGMF